MTEESDGTRVDPACEHPRQRRGRLTARSIAGIALAVGIAFSVSSDWMSDPGFGTEVTVVFRSGTSFPVALRSRGGDWYKPIAFPVFDGEQLKRDSMSVFLGWSRLDVVTRSLGLGPHEYWNRTRIVTRTSPFEVLGAYELAHYTVLDGRVAPLTPDASFNDVLDAHGLEHLPVE